MPIPRHTLAWLSNTGAAVQAARHTRCLSPAFVFTGGERIHDTFVTSTLDPLSGCMRSRKRNNRRPTHKTPPHARVPVALVPLPSPRFQIDRSPIYHAFVPSVGTKKCISFRGKPSPVCCHVQPRAHPQPHPQLFPGQALIYFTKIQKQPNPSQPLSPTTYL